MSKIDGLAAIIIAAVTLFVLLTPLRAENLTGDSVRYMGLADSIGAGRGYEFNFRPHTRFPPGTPLLLAAVHGMTGGGYGAYVTTMALFAGLSLVAAYRLLRSLGHTTLALAAVLAVSASMTFYERATQGANSDLPFYAFFAAALTIAVRTELGDVRRGFLLRAGAFALLVVGTLLIRSAGLALVGALALWLLLHAVRGPRATRQQTWTFLPALALGMLVQGLWWWWAALNKMLYWPGEYMNSYFAQLTLKNPHEPTLGQATATDFVARAAANIINHAADTSALLLNLPFVDPRWFSPLVVVPVLLVTVGVIGHLRSSPRVVDLFFVLYVGLYLLWPFDEAARYMFPLFPLVLSYGWQGLKHGSEWAARAQHSALMLAAGATAVTVGGLLTLIVSDAPAGRQAAASLLAWVSLAGLLAFGLRGGGEPLRRMRLAITEHVGARWLWGIGIATVAFGFLQQVPVVRDNLDGSRARLTHHLSIDAAQWLRPRLSQGESVMAGQEAVVHYVTGYRAIPFPVTKDGAMIADTINRHNVGYLVIYRNETDPYFLPTEEARVAILDRTCPGLLSMVVDQPGYNIYQVTPRLCHAASLEVIGQARR